MNSLTKLLQQVGGTTCVQVTMTDWVWADPVPYHAKCY